MREDRRQPQSTVQTLKHNSRAGRISRDLLTDTNRRFEGQQMDDIALKRSRDGEKNRFGRNVGRETSRGEKQAIGRKESWNRKRDNVYRSKLWYFPFLRPRDAFNHVYPVILIHTSPLPIHSPYLCTSSFHSPSPRIPHRFWSRWLYTVYSHALPDV